MKTSELRATYPPYFIAKNRIDLTPDTDVDALLAKVKEMYKNEEINDIDGVKIDFADKWVHLRKSNTEPIIRVYSEAVLFYDNQYPYDKKTFFDGFAGTASMSRTGAAGSCP